MAAESLPAGPGITRVTEYIFLGGADAAEPATLRDHGITRVVRLYAGPPDVRAPGVEYVVFPAEDSLTFDIRPIAVEAVLELQAATNRRERVLIHCHMGISRSATIVLLFLMVRHDIPLSDALASLRKVRPCVEPNATFMAMLEATDQSLQLRRLQLRRQLHAAAAAGRSTEPSGSHRGRPRQLSRSARGGAPRGKAQIRVERRGPG